MFTHLARQGAGLAAHPFSALFALLLFGVWLAAESAGHRGAELIAGGSAVITLAIVFLLHHAQYHDTRALHAKIDELIVSLEGPRDELAGIEQRAIGELEDITRDPSHDS